MVSASECWSVCLIHLVMIYLEGVITAGFRQTELLLFLIFLSRSLVAHDVLLTPSFKRNHFLHFQSKRWVHTEVVKTFYFNLKETSKNSVQSLYYLFTKAGVLSLRNTRGAGTKKVEIKKYKMNYSLFSEGDSKGEVCIGIGNKDSKMREDFQTI